MIRGLRIYLLRIYWSQGIKSCFSRKYWDRLIEWKWSKTFECFDQPKARQLYSNVTHDPNKMVKLMAKLRIEKQKLANLQKKAREEDEVSEAKTAETRMKEAVADHSGPSSKQLVSRTVGSKSNPQDTEDNQQEEDQSIVTSVSKILSGRAG